MRRALALLLTLLLPLMAVSQEGSPGPPAVPASSQQETAAPAESVSTPGQEAAQREALPTVDPSLLNKKVVVYLRDGRVYKGKLVELTQDSLRLKMDGRTEQIALAQVTMMERQRSRAWLGVAIAGIAVGAVAVGALIAAMQD